MSCKQQSHLPNCPFEGHFSSSLFLSLQGYDLKKTISWHSWGNTSMVMRHTEAGFGSGTGESNRHCHVRNKCDHRPPGAAMKTTPHVCLVSTNEALSRKMMLVESPSNSGCSSWILRRLSYISAQSRLIFSFFSGESLLDSAGGRLFSPVLKAPWLRHANINVI